MREFAAVESTMEPELKKAESLGIHTTLSPIFKTPQEVEHGSPLFLDMTDQARIMYDKQHFPKSKRGQYPFLFGISLEIKRS